ncbi:hypothetical protein FBUS_05939 [Fasciolopsis buskii]|uniref:Uncharacterized protein n=1 Tax=Fasciolopsis buskii TaxID=27845 RepID=A0A8E0VE32_9TREM|nr:hypothetical protein FBUS_05939 [Fasciolopsis buski]
MFIIVFFALKTVPLLIISTNAMTSELASFITSVFTMDLLDIDSMLRKDSNLTESEQKVIYRQAKDIQEVLSWFNVKPTGVNQTLECKNIHSTSLSSASFFPRLNILFILSELDVILPTSYLNRAGNELLADFTTIQFVDNEPRAPLEEIYTEAPIEKKPLKARKSSEPSRSILKLMTEKLSEIKRTFEDPLRDQESALSRLGTKLLDGWKRMTEKTKAAAETKAEEEEEEEPEGQQEVVAYETGRIAITARTVSEESRKKLRQKPVKRPKVSESPSDRVVIAPILDEDMEKHAPKRAHTPRELMLIKPPYADVLTMLPGVKKTTTKRVHDIVGSSAPYAVVTNLTSPRISPKLPGIASTPTTRTRGTRRRDSFATPSAVAIREQKLDEHVRSVAWAIKQIPTSKKTKRKTTMKDSSIQTISSPRSLSSSGRSVDIHSPMESIMVQPGSVEGREPPFRFMSSLGTPLSSTGAHLGDSTVSEMLKRAVSPGKVRPQTLEVVGEQVDRMSDEAQRLSEIEEITPKATGVWTWLDTLLASQAKSPTLPVQFYETMPPESKYGALRRLHKRAGTGLISRFEEKGAHLQYLVRNLEDTHMLPCSDRESAPIQIKSTEDEQPKSLQETHRGGPVFTAASPGTQRAEQIRKRLIEKGMLSPVPGRGAHLETEKVAQRTSRDSVGINRFATDIEYATKYLQTVFQPGQLTQLLNEIQKGGTSLEALSALEEALIIAANKAEAAEHEEWMHIRGSPRPPGIPPGQWHLIGTSKELNKLQTDNFHQINKGVHCRYALLAQKGFHKQGLSIAAHLARMELVECINKAIQQRGKSA